MGKLSQFCWQHILTVGIELPTEVPPLALSGEVRPRDLHEGDDPENGPNGPRDRTAGIKVARRPGFYHFTPHRSLSKFILFPRTLK